MVSFLYLLIFSIIRSLIFKDNDSMSLLVLVTSSILLSMRENKDKTCTCFTTDVNATAPTDGITDNQKLRIVEKITNTCEKALV